MSPAGNEFIAQMDSMKWWVCVRHSPCECPDNQFGCEGYRINKIAKKKFIKYLRRIDRKYWTFERLSAEFKISLSTLQEVFKPKGGKKAA